MRRVDGWLAAHFHPDDHVPFVLAELEHEGQRFEYAFMIDTGSDQTTLMPVDAYDLLGDSYFAMDFENDPKAIEVEGVGTSGYRALPLDQTLRLVDDLDNPIALSTPIWIAEPQPGYPSNDGNWALPSLFGRDAIRPGDFELSYINGTVTLIRPDNE